MKLALVVPHIFMQDSLLHKVIFSPGELALALTEGLVDLGIEVTLFTPGKVTTKAQNVTPELSGFENELNLRGYGYVELLQKHPLTFITLARQVQSQIIADVFARANQGEFDLVHIYTNEEELAIVNARFCKVPVVFTHHEPFNFLTRYRTIMPQFKHLPWISISLSQRNSMPKDTNWVGNVHHGIDLARFQPNTAPKGDYIAYFGRIIEPKGVHLAIKAAQKAGLKLKIAGKHYSGHAKDKYWETQIKPHIDSKKVEYIGFLNNDQAKQEFLGNARALIVPSTWEEPFGMVMLEAMACATPVIGLNSGAIPEIINNPDVGTLVEQGSTQSQTISRLAKAIKGVTNLNRINSRLHTENNFSIKAMCEGHLAIYKKLS
jgi:glycosyltransferase involved in cell wall biosynthesis